MMGDQLRALIPVAWRAVIDCAITETELEHLARGWTRTTVRSSLSDTIQFRSPPPSVQKVLFGVLASMAHALGYRGTYAQLSRSIALRETPEGRPAPSPG